MDNRIKTRSDSLDRFLLNKTNKSPFEKSARTSRSPISKRKLSSPEEGKELKNKKMEYDSRKLEDKVDKILKLLEISRNENAELKLKLDNIEKSLQDERVQRERDLKNMNQELNKFEKKLKQCYEKIDSFENRERRANLVFKGVQEHKEEFSSETEEILKTFIQDYLKFSPVEIARAQRIGKYNSNSKFPRIIIVKFMKESEKKRVLQNKNNLRGTNYFIEEDFSWEVRQIRKKLLERAKLERQNGKKTMVRNKSLFIDGIKWNGVRKKTIS